MLGRRSLPIPPSAWTTGVASCVAWVTLGCERPSDQVTHTPNSASPGADTSGACPPCVRTPPGSADDRTAPVILGARFIARDRLQLTFSEVLAPVVGVNPRQFRLSNAESMMESSGGGASRSGIGSALNEDIYASATYYDAAGPDTYEAPLVVVALELSPQHPDILVLALSQPISVELCEEIAEQRTVLLEDAATAAAADRVEQGQVGLFLHYTTRGSEGVRDLADNPLAELGGHWALNFGARSMELYGSDPVARLDLLPEIPCPEPDTDEPSPAGVRRP